MYFTTERIEQIVKELKQLIYTQFEEKEFKYD